MYWIGAVWIAMAVGFAIEDYNWSEENDPEFRTAAAELNSLPYGKVTIFTLKVITCIGLFLIYIAKWPSQLILVIYLALTKRRVK